MTFPRLIAATALLLLLAAPQATAQSCTPIEIVWPSAENPVWELTAFPPSISTPSWRGSGLEIRDVRYRGISVLKRGHVPMINVKYDHGTCFRDWANSNTRFQASNQTANCFAQPPAGTVQTVCETGVGMPDIGTFQGVAMEDFGDGFTITSQSQAGWYRYKISWTFELDGTIRPEFGFSHTSNSMAENPRRHHIYWRLDFDIETADHNFAAVSRAGAPWEVLPNETTQSWTIAEELVSPRYWAVFNLESRRGYRLAPGAKEYNAPSDPGTGNPELDNFANEDIAFSRYRPGQLTDGDPGCAVNFFHGSNPIIQNQSIQDADIVVWYRTGVRRLGGNGPDAPDTCQPLGPILQPIGDWGQDSPANVALGEPSAESRRDVTLEAFPNPFDGQTTIRFTLEREQEVTIRLYDIAGREVRVVHEPARVAGTNEIRLDAADLPNGVYTVRLTGSEGVEASRRIVLVR